VGLASGRSEQLHRQVYMGMPPRDLAVCALRFIKVNTGNGDLARLAERPLKTVAAAARGARVGGGDDVLMGDSNASAGAASPGGGGGAKKRGRGGDGH
jgi:hypothetical protein